jgi:hypothetical protein
MEERNMTEIIMILVLGLVCVNTLLIIRIGNYFDSQNEKLMQEIEKLERGTKELEIMLKDRIVHVTHKIRE